MPSEIIFLHRESTNKNTGAKLAPKFYIRTTFFFHLLFERSAIFCIIWKWVQIVHTGLHTTNHCWRQDDGKCYRSVQEVGLMVVVLGNGLICEKPLFIVLQITKHFFDWPLLHSKQAQWNKIKPTSLVDVTIRIGIRWTYGQTDRRVKYCILVAGDFKNESKSSAECLLDQRTQQTQR